MILVTGASGMSGSIIVREFSKRGHRVRALVRHHSRGGDLRALPGVELVEGDMADPKTLGPALDGVERALLISAANAQMAETQCTFIDACRDAGVRHVVKFSGRESGIGFDQTKFRFTKMHEDVERYLERSGLLWTHLRPSQFMQVYLREARAIAAHGALRLPFGDIALAPVDIDDIAKIAVGALTSDSVLGEGLEITGPEELTMPEIACHIGDVIGRPVQYIPISIEERRRALQAAGVPSDFIDALDEQAAERVKHPRSRVDLGAHERFGIRPTTFATFAERNASLFRATGVTV